MRVRCFNESGDLFLSSPQPIEYGTPQGSVLGPLIFLLFNNDLHLHLQFTNCILFADDTTIYSTCHDLRHLTWCVREDLRTISDWFKANKLTLNLNKSVCILFGNSNTARSLCLNELNQLGIPVADHIQFLGILLDENLNWTYHYNHVMFKIKHNLNLLKQGGNLLTTYAKKILYYGHIYSHLSYGISIWGPMLQQSQKKKLQKLQNKCFNLRRISTHEKSVSNKLLPINELIQLELSKIGYKTLTGTLLEMVLKTIQTDQNQNK